MQTQRGIWNLWEKADFRSLFFNSLDHTQSKNIFDGLLPFLNGHPHSCYPNGLTIVLHCGVCLVLIPALVQEIPILAMSFPREDEWMAVPINWSISSSILDKPSISRVQRPRNGAGQVRVEQAMRAWSNTHVDSTFWKCEHIHEEVSCLFAARSISLLWMRYRQTFLPWLGDPTWDKIPIFPADPIWPSRTKSEVFFWKEAVETLTPLFWTFMLQFFSF